VAKDKIEVSERDYARNLRPQKARYFLANSWKTDGIRVQRLAFDLARKAQRSIAGPQWPPIFRLERHFKKYSKLAKLNTTPCPFGGIIGIDPGQTWTAAAFFLPSDPTQSGSQVALRKRFLYGHERKNREWLEHRKALKGIHEIEANLSKSNSNAVNLREYIASLRVRQLDGNAQKLRDFYNSGAVRHRAWDTGMSMRSSLDISCEIIERLAGEARNQENIIIEEEKSRRHRHERNHPLKPLIFVIGDGDFSTSSRGSRPSLHGKFLKQLVRRSRGPPGSVFLMADEYMTSKTCPCCLGDISYWKRPARYKREKMEAVNGLVDERRIQRCESCDKYFHRDCAAAQCMCIIAESLLTSGHKPTRFIRAE
jgi:hypothetical protein